LCSIVGDDPRQEPLLAGQRQQLIVEEIRRRGAARVSELTELLSVSEMTIRRDLDVLATSGLIEKVHGGATALRMKSTEEPGFEAKSHRQREEKELIAQAASRMVNPGQAIGLTAGTTTWRLAHHIQNVPNLTVVTNSIQVANVLHREPRPDLTVVLTGGVRTPSDALVGPVTVATVKALNIDVLFMGVHGMSQDAGFTTPNLLEAEANQALIASASQVVVLADRTKWGVRGLSQFARLSDAQILISDTGLPASARTILEEHVQQLVLVPVPRTGRSHDGTS
jgi:DeoR/GlpR family transcriptional regulator of sugar metabolism